MLVNPTRRFLPTNMVRTTVLVKVCMRKQNTNKVVTLEVVPELRTERFSPKFRPGDRFCELCFRYLSPDSEGEKCRPLDNICQIPFIHSGQLIIGGNFYTYVKFLQLFSTCGTSSIPWHRAYLIIARALLQKHSF